MLAKKSEKVVFFLRKLYQSFVPVDDATAKLMETLPANDENFFSLTRLTKAEMRSAAQNRLMWMWITDASKTTVNELAGRTKEDWHYELKKRFLVPIYERDDMEYALTIQTLRVVHKNGLKNEASMLYKHIVDMTSTTQATVEQFTEYLTDIGGYLRENGVLLRTDQQLFNYAMGLN